MDANPTPADYAVVCQGYLHRFPNGEHFTAAARDLYRKLIRDAVLRYKPQEGKRIPIDGLCLSNRRAHVLLDLFATDRITRRAFRKAEGMDRRS